jgi:hypothetical protein
MGRGIYICAGVTALSGLVAYGLVPFTGMTNAPTPHVFFLWNTFMFMVCASYVFWTTLKMALRRQERPFATLWASADWKQIKSMVLWTLLLALNLLFFCTIKAQLGQVVAFSADPLLADVDKVLLGSDAWRLVQWFNHPGLPLLYHRAWFLWLAFVIFWLLRSPESAEKDRLFIGYVLMWSVFGPVVHLMLPAAGPVFYSDLGLGDRFAGLQQWPTSVGTKNYLWNGYVNKMFYDASGISAMPSLHLATMFWTLIAVRNTRWMILGCLFTAYIFLGSIAIGWHYAIDGIAGGIGAVLCYWVAGIKLPKRTAQETEPLPEFSGVAAPVHCQAERA